MAFKWGANKILNKPGHHTTAAIASEMHVWSSQKSVSCTVTISDCERTISLEFGADANKKEDYENAIYKFDALIKTLKRTRKEYKRVWREELKHDG